MRDDIKDIVRRVLDLEGAYFPDVPSYIASVEERAKAAAILAREVARLRSACDDLVREVGRLTAESEARRLELVGVAGERDTAFAILADIGNALAAAGVEVSAVMQDYPGHVATLAADRITLSLAMSNLDAIECGLIEGASLPETKDALYEACRRAWDASRRGAYHPNVWWTALADEAIEKMTGHLREKVSALEAERDEARKALGECFLLSGADPDGDDWRHNWPRGAEEVRTLRKDYDEVCEESVERDRRATAAETFLAHEGYRRCDVRECNCGEWHKVRTT